MGTGIRGLSFVLAVLGGATFFSGCAAKSKPEIAARVPAGAAECETFNGLPAESKRDQLFSRHLQSAEKAAEFSKFHFDSAAVLSGRGGAAAQYVEKFVGGYLRRSGYDLEATKATLSFLVPGAFQNLGYKRLEPTFTRECDFFETPRPKMVHAFGTLAKARMILFPKLQELGADGKPTGRVFENPWTGLFSPKNNSNGVPMLLRFSIANPVPLRVGDYFLEFIPGAGMKFFIDGKKSVDLLAMESLAGQGADYDFFKYEFSPDFSKHAPPDFNTASGSEKKAILARYRSNWFNAKVMNEVGERFFQIIPDVYHVDPKSLNPHSALGPHPFVISIQKLAQFDSAGNEYSASEMKRPWRLVFKPELGALGDRYKAVTDPTPYNPMHLETDFRYKLAHLKPGDVVYAVIGETRAGERYVLGKIVLETAPIPSLFADRELFIQHELDFRARYADTIVEPSLQ